MDVSIDDNIARRRYDVSVDGQPAGLVTYVHEGTTRVLMHAGIDSAFEGRGIGGRAVALVLGHSRGLGERVAPVCSFIAAYIEAHAEYQDLVDRDVLDVYRRP